MAVAGSDIDIHKLMSSGRILKDDTATTVVRAMWSGRDVVVKRYNYRGIFRAIADAARGSRARRAWRKGHLLLRIGVATPEPLAFIETKKFGLVRESFLITPYIEGANFHHYIRNKNLPADAIRRVAEQVRKILDTLATHKISHGDTKPSNFLVAGDVPVITDLDSMKIHRTTPMAQRWAKKDLMRFLTRINTDDIPAETRRLCTTACGYDGPVPYQLANDYFEISAHQNNGWYMLIRRGLNQEDAKAITAGGVCRDESRYVRFRSSKTARVWTATAGFKGGNITIFIKEHLHRSAFDFIKHLFRDSRARRAFSASIILRRNGFDCPETLALLEKRFGPFCIKNVLVTFGVTGCVKTQTYFRQLAGENTWRAELEKRMILTNLGACIGRMHKSGIYHGDLRTGNIMPQNQAGLWHFHLIDNERTRQFATIPRRLIVKNLVQINMFQENISNADRMRFFKAYNEQMQLTDVEMRRLCGQVIRRTNKRLKMRVIRHPA